MKRIIIIIFLLTSAIANAGAQQPQLQQRGRRMERIHAIKVGYITDRLHFTSEQSARFWPVYDKYEDELRTTRRNFFQKYKNNNGEENDVQSRKFIEDNLDYQEQELALKRKYKDQFLQVISAQQLAQLYQAERDFKKLLLQQLRNARNDRREDRGGDRGNN